MTRWLRSVLAAFGVVLVSGCRGEVLQVGADDPEPIVLGGECRDRPSNSRSFDTYQALEAALVGRWYRCRGIAGGILYPQGIELADDNHWYALVDDGTGKFVRATDPAHRGVWGAEPPVTVHVVFENKAQQTLVVLFDPDGAHFSVERSTFETVDIGYVRQAQ